MVTEEQKTKYVEQFKLQLNGVLGVFNMHGMLTLYCMKLAQIYIPDTIDVITELALLLHKSLNGIEAPITVEHAEIKRKKRLKK